MSDYEKTRDQCIESAECGCTGLLPISNDAPFALYFSERGTHLQVILLLKNPVCGDRIEPFMSRMWLNEDECKVLATVLNNHLLAIERGERPILEVEEEDD